MPHHSGRYRHRTLPNTTPHGYYARMGRFKQHYVHPAQCATGIHTSGHAEISPIAVRECDLNLWHIPCPGKPGSRDNTFARIQGRAVYRAGLNVPAVLGYKPKNVAFILYKLAPAAKYETFQIRKKSGGFRAVPKHHAVAAAQK